MEAQNIYFRDGLVTGNFSRYGDETIITVEYAFDRDTGESVHYSLGFESSSIGKALTELAQEGQTQLSGPGGSIELLLRGNRIVANIRTPGMSTANLPLPFELPRAH